MKRRILISIAMWWLAVSLTGPARAGSPDQEQPVNHEARSLAIVVNTANPVDNLSMAELRKVFLGERSHWPNGRRITLVMMDQGQPERTTLIREVCQMSESDFNKHFLHGLFTGEVFVSPKTLSSPVGVRKFIFNVPGAIGYVRLSDVDSTVKVLRVDGLRPEDKDYALRIPQNLDNR
jgi:phosphate transport system substrate-binding protein